MSSFTSTRHEFAADSNSSQQTSQFLTLNGPDIKEPMKENVYFPASEANPPLSLENTTFFDPQWNSLVDFNCFEQYNQENLELFFNCTDVIKAKVPFPVNQTVTPCKNIIHPSYTNLDDLFVTGHHTIAADHHHSLLTNKKAGGKLSWRQSILLEKKAEQEEKQKCSYISWTSSASPSLAKIEPVHSIITNKGPVKSQIISSASEPIPNRFNCPQPSLSEQQIKSSRYDSYSNHNGHSITNITLSKDLGPSQPEACLVAPNSVQDSFSDSLYYDHFEPTPTMWVAMPRRQKPRYEGDYYAPKWVRYTGHLKQGYCDSCSPGKWLQLKNSAYWYHKQFYHGISSVSGQPFMKPIKQRLGKGDTIEGLCHQCKRYVPATNAKKKNNYMLWYRHAHKCHLYEKPKTTSSSKSSSVSSGTSMTD